MTESASGLSPGPDGNQVMNKAYSLAGEFPLPPEIAAMPLESWRFPNKKHLIDNTVSADPHFTTAHYTCYLFTGVHSLMCAVLRDDVRLYPVPPHKWP